MEVIVVYSRKNTYLEASLGGFVQFVGAFSRNSAYKRPLGRVETVVAYCRNNTCD